MSSIFTSAEACATMLIFPALQEIVWAEAGLG
jgi:hypothetical protein